MTPTRCCGLCGTSKEPILPAGPWFSGVPNPPTHVCMECAGLVRAAVWRAQAVFKDIIAEAVKEVVSEIRNRS